MATELVVHTASTAGVAPDAHATAIDATGNTFMNTGSEYLFVAHAGAVGSVTLVITTTGTSDGEPITDRTIVIPKTANNEVLIGPFPTAMYNSAAGLVTMAWTGDAGDLAATTALAFR